ncbi:hypothetical protein RDWZM_008740 [Blomia tropicalis]|uniref:Thrombospondin-like N-terminal domain-containing protein n=1 Tax=Blomia tropicalis TaxID=40697 RepID=A0A9Q0RJ44_BLOTA|nr:hypothetical protein RDWZM_008740 [Blomia tropicalis]
MDNQLPEEGLFCPNLGTIVEDDLPNFDLLHRFRMEMDNVEGTDSVQSAYRLQSDSQFQMATRFGLSIVPEQQVVRFYTTQDNYRTPLQTYTFENVPLYEDNWNKIDLSIYPSDVSLYVNCKKLGQVSLKPRPMIDMTGDTWVGKYDDDFTTVQLDLQWLVMNCDASRPQRDDCNQIPIFTQPVHKNLLTKSDHNVVAVVEQQCCQESMSRDEIKTLVIAIVKDNLELLRGPPGKTGRPGKSVIGPQGRAGEPGTNGERGYPGMPGREGRPGFPGPKGDKGEVGLKGCQGDTGPMGAKGNSGEPGLRGPPGIGQKGLKGDRGHSGNSGPPGVRGPQGPVGPPGICNSECNFAMLQRILSQSQQQTKGPIVTKGPL